MDALAQREASSADGEDGMKVLKKDGTIGVVDGAEGRGSDASYKEKIDV